MRQLQVEDAELMTIAIQQELSRSEEARYDHRLHGVLLVGQGLSCLETAQLLGQDPVTVQRWVHRFNQRGFAGLHEGERPGRPASLSAAQWEGLGRDLRRPPRELQYEQNLWDGKLLAHHLRSRFGVPNTIDAGDATSRSPTQTDCARGGRSPVASAPAPP